MFLLPDASSLLSNPDKYKDAISANSRKRQLRKAQSHDSLLAPLVRAVRNPASALESIVEGFRNDRAEEQSKDAEERECEKKILYARLKTATTYDDWRTHASELDRLEGNDVWKQERDSDEYDPELVGARLKQLDDARINCDVGRMLFLIRTSLTRSLGGMGDARLYKHSHIGTKDLIERYNDSACQTITKLLELSTGPLETECDSRKVLDQILATRQSFGRSALLLSGGGTFGMNHIGVVKGLWEAELLPRIISGSSAGSIVCAVLCTKTDAELPVVVQEFCYGELDVFEKEGEEESVLRKAARFMKHGSIFDIAHLVRVMRNLLGDLTFQEAYNRTRRILNITVSSASLYELPRLLNYITAPNVIIWSAVAASCSVPFIFSAASLLAKDAKTGAEVPWNPSQSHWIDGSVDNDLPMTRLAELFNVNHFIVSQVNPHVVPFLKNEDTIGTDSGQFCSAVTTGSTWFHTMADLAKGEALHRVHMLAELGVFPNYLMKFQSVLSQRYSGDITIFPEIPYSHFPKVLKNPTTEFMLQAMLAGERATWPKLSRILNHCAIELALDDAVQKLRTRVVFSPSQVDLRMNAFSQATPANGSSGQSNKRRSRPKHRHAVTRSNDSSKAAPLLRKAPPPYLLPPQPISHRKARSDQLAIPLLATAPADHAFPKTLTIPKPPAYDLFSETETLLSPSSAADDELGDSGPDSLSASPASSPNELPPNTASSAPLPNLWASSRLLFPSASQPATPSTRLPNTFQAASLPTLDPPSPLADLKMTPRYPPATSTAADQLSGSTLNSPDPPTHPGVSDPSNKPADPAPAHATRVSSPERRYKRLFHGTDASALGLVPAPPPVLPELGARLWGEREREADVGREGTDWSGTKGMVRRKRSLSTGLKGLAPPGEQ
ncbi:MAG: hypothetical protein M1822_000730 [Bathelium mastoideum]|nr:MAG: hypothetical protein M1822_000730 [Bathelium mastoideum]